MRTKSSNDYIYIGKEAGKEIHEKIKNAKKSVKVVSPYLSGDYIIDLIDLHKKEVKVTLITCDKIEVSPYSAFRISDLVKKERIRDEKAGRLKKVLFGSFIWLFAISVLLVILTFILPVLALFVIAAVLFFIGLVSLISSKVIPGYSFKYEPIFRIKVFDSKSGDKPWSTQLVHSKIFVIDEETAFLGSVNFTYSGFKTHYETAIKIEDKTAVEDISKEIERLYYSSDLRAKGIEEW